MVLITKGRSAKTSMEIASFPSSPSLIGYWACDEGSGSTLIDNSGNGYHLSLELTSESDYGMGSIASMWSYKPGYLTLKNGDRAFIDADSTLLDTGTKAVVMSCELINGTVLDDCDLGTAWDVKLAPTGGYRGFSISTLGAVQGFRISVYDAGNGQAGHTDLFWDQAVEGAAPVNSANGIAGAFVPSDAAKVSINGAAVIEDATAYSELEITSSQFALKSAHNAASEQGITGTSIRNVQLWAFDSVPDNVDMVLQWLSANPTKMPKWWRGL